MSDRELQFHYFKLHDYDNNNLLDGLEIVKALKHSHEEGMINKCRHVLISLFCLILLSGVVFMKNLGYEYNIKGVVGL